MNDKLIKVPTGQMTDAQWLEYRRNGLGGSEVGIVLGLSPYKSALELFYDKLKPPVELNESEPMHWGSALEDLIADRWQYWDTDAATMMANYAAGKIVRKCSRVNAYVINPKWPHLFISLDRRIHKNGSDEGVLEVKNISGYVTKIWEGGVPPYQLAQIQDYLLVTELSHGELAILKDGRYMDVIPFKTSQIIQDAILEKTTTFWEKVKAATAILIQEGVGNYEYITRKDALAEIGAIEPEPDGSEAYEAFINKRYFDKPITRPGTEEQYQTALKYLQQKDVIKQAEDAARLHSNTLKAEMGEVQELDFGKPRGKITWLPTVKGSRVFNVKVK